MTESKDAAEATDKANGIAKNMWLASLGAYGRMVDQAQQRYSKLRGKIGEQAEQQDGEESNNSLFEELIVKGRELENKAQDKISDVRQKASSNFGDRLNKVKESMSLPAGDNQGVSSKLDDIVTKLDLVLENLSKPPAAEKKPLPKKVAAKTTSRKAADIVKDAVAEKID